MVQASKTFRIFVSSTFNDLKEERNALQRYVFPRLRDLCMRSGCRFQAMDLRWGVSVEAGHERQTMKICLGEIERCQKTTPRPNFIVLLGDRYGACPLPAEIPEDEFKQIIEKITGTGDEELINYWYRCDENAVPPVYCLKERDVNIAEDATDKEKAGTQKKETEEWKENEKKLRLILIKVIDQLGWREDDIRYVKYRASATEQEINQGALKPGDAQGHVFCFFRSINGLPEDISAKDFRDIDNDGNLDNIAKSQLDNLKTRLSKKLKDNVLNYNSNWTDEGLSTDHIGTLPNKLEDCLKLNDGDTIPSALCADVWRKLSKVIEEEIAQFEHVDALEKEIENHNKFGENRARFFVGRASTLKKISDYLKGTDTHPLAVFGVSGSGKSALIARAVEQAQSEHKNAVVIMRFIGATPESSDGRALFESLCRQISRGYGADESTVPNDYKKLVEEFPKRLSLATSEKPLFIFLDALDQLSNTDSANSLIWIPRELPRHVHLVISTLLGEEKKLPSSIRIELEKMPHKDGNQLLDLWLKDAKRSLQEDQKKEVLNKFKKSGLPLYLKLAFEEARTWKSYDGIPLGSNGKQGLSQNIPGIIRDLFSRLSNESNHGKMMFSRSMGYLAASKNGLTEDEMLDVLSEDDELYQDFLIRARHIPSEKKLPVVIWSRLYFDLEPYLTERNADGTSLMAFFHRQVGEVVFEEYLKDAEKKKRHRILAKYFGKKPYWAEFAKLRLPNIRKTSELPYQQAYAGMDELVDTLTDFNFMDAKLHALEISSLIDDYDLVSIIGVGEKVKRSEKSLRLIQGALRLSAHVLEEERSQLPSQMTGRLLTFEETEIKALIEQMKEWKGAPWLRPLMLSLASPGGPLLRTLAGHSDGVMAVAVTADGRRVVSGSDDNTLKVWDVESGKVLHTLEGHSDDVNAVAVKADGRRAVSGSDDNTLKVWDMETGKVLNTLVGHSEQVSAVAVTADGRRAVSGSWDKTLKIWDLKTGKVLYTLAGHSEGVNAVAVTTDGRRAVSGSDDNNTESMGYGNRKGVEHP